MLASFDPSKTCFRNYVEDEDGVQFECLDFDDQTLCGLANAADELIVRIPEAKSRIPDRSVKELSASIESLVRAKKYGPAIRQSLVLPSWREIAVNRQHIRSRISRRILCGTARKLSAPERTVLAVAIVPFEVVSCFLTIKL